MYGPLAPNLTPTKVAGRRIVRRAARSTSLIVGASLVLLIVLAAVLAPWLAPFDPLEVSLFDRSLPPSLEHPMGTDTFGRDVLSRVLWGSRLSLLMGFGSVAIGATLGIVLGLVSGYVGGWIDSALMRMVDVFISFGLLLLAILVMAILGTGLINTMFAVGTFLFVAFARLTRGEVLSVRDLEYVEASRALGAFLPRVLLRYILPNISGPLIVLASLRLGEAILAEASLSFLGLGASPPTPSWGLMVSDGLSSLRQAPWISLMPGGAIVLTVLGFNLFGDGLRDLLDPRLR